MINLNKKYFRSVDNSTNGEVSNLTRFNYYQEGNNVWADYNGGQISRGHLFGIMDDNGNLNMSYHHINNNNEIMTGICRSTVKILPDGRLRFFEQWQWTNADKSKGTSVIEELIS